MSVLARSRRALERFARVEASSGAALLIASLVALAIANGPYGEAFARVWASPRALPWLGSSVSLEQVVDEGLMVPFFLVAGLEIRREVERGALRGVRRATLPAAAALGGMIVPALVYRALASDPSARAGWGIPTATDIAFALGALALVGRRAPPELRALLLALAVLDDLGAVLVIGVFYSHSPSVVALALVAAALVAVVVLARARVRSAAAWAAVGVALWAALLHAGIHPALAGAVIGLATPAEAPGARADRWIARLHPWVAFGVMPLFAFAHAGVALSGAPSHPGVLAGVTAGLLFGKPIGVLVGVGVAVVTGAAKLPRGLGGRHVLVLGALAGVGFTMSLFVAHRAFDDAALLVASKRAIVLGSALSAVAGILLGRFALPARPAALDDEAVSER